MDKHFVTARRYLDNRVQNPSNEQLGRVEDIVLDLESGRITEVIIRCDRRHGLFGHYFATVPFNELQPAFGDRVLVWDMDWERLEAQQRLKTSYHP